MIRFVSLFALIFGCGPLGAEIVVTTRIIRAQTVISPEDLTFRDATISGAYSDPAAVVGMEARVALYPGRPIRNGDIGLPSVIERNQIVTLIYTRAGVTISAEGRALDRAAVGDRIRALNQASRNPLTGVVQSDGTILVSH